MELPLGLQRLMMPPIERQRAMPCYHAIYASESRGDRDCTGPRGNSREQLDRASFVAQQLMSAHEKELACLEKAQETELRRQQEEHERDTAQAVKLAKAPAENEEVSLQANDSRLQTAMLLD